MPWMKDGKRDYRREYDLYQGKKKNIKKRSLRNSARAELAKMGKVKKGDGKDVDHRKPLSKGGGNSIRNLRVRSASSNRSFPRTRGGRMK